MAVKKKQTDGKSKPRAAATKKKKPAGGKNIRLADGMKQKRPGKPAASRKTTKELKPLQEKLLKLFTRPNGATITDTVNAGFRYPAMAALKMAERHGYKVTVKKQPGELTRYIAKR